MHVPQLPASQLKGGSRPARRAVSSSVSPGTCGTVTFLRSRWIVTVLTSAPFTGSVTRWVSSMIRVTVDMTAPNPLLAFSTIENTILPSDRRSSQDAADVGSAGPAREGRDVTEPAALVFEERQLTLPELDALASGLANSLAKIGVAA